jgi:hypothetical protein
LQRGERGRGGGSGPAAGNWAAVKELGRARGAGPVGKEEGEKAVGCGVLGQKGGGEGFGEFFSIFSNPFQTLNSNIFLTFQTLKLFKPYFFQVFKLFERLLKLHTNKQ